MASLHWRDFARLLLHHSLHNFTAGKWKSAPFTCGTSATKFEIDVYFLQATYAVGSYFFQWLIVYSHHSILAFHWARASNPWWGFRRLPLSFRPPTLLFPKTAVHTYRGNNMDASFSRFHPISACRKISCLRMARGLWCNRGFFGYCQR